MKENQIVVNDKDLSDKWFNDAVTSIETTKKIIELLINSNQIDLYDDNEELSKEKAEEKQAIKEHNIVLPLTYSIEKMIKSLVLKLNDEHPANRNTRVMKILNEVRDASQIKGSLHNLMIFIDYINSIDDTFLDILGRMYMSRREGYGNYANRSHEYSQSMKMKERVTYANNMYREAFVKYRYLFEKQAKEDSIDLIKLIDYAESVRDACTLIYIKEEILNLLSNKLNESNSNINITDYKKEIRKLINKQYYEIVRDNYENTTCLNFEEAFCVFVENILQNLVYSDIFQNMNYEEREEFLDYIWDNIDKYRDKQRNYLTPSYAKYYAKISYTTDENIENNRITKIENHEIMPIKFYCCGSNIIDADLTLDQNNNVIIDSFEINNYLNDSDADSYLPIIKAFFKYLLNNKDQLSLYFNKPIKDFIYENYILSTKENANSFGENKKKH